MSSKSPEIYIGICKQVLSGDTIVLQSRSDGIGPPKEKQLHFTMVSAPRLARRGTADSQSESSTDQPCAWESREFLRKKVIGRKVIFLVDNKQQNKDYGYAFLGNDIETGENIIEKMIQEGLLQVRRKGVKDLNQRFLELEEAAKKAQVGRWSPDAWSHVRNIIWSVDNPHSLVDKYAHKPVSAVIEHVRDGSTVRAFLLPDMYYVTVIVSGIRCPTMKIGADGRPDVEQAEPYFEQARYFVQCRMLQRDVQIVLESVNNSNYVGSILHPNGNIAELLLREGLARCVDWSVLHAQCGAEVLRAAEKHAKQNRLRLWKEYLPHSLQNSKEEFDALVTEIINGDAMYVRPHGSSESRKIFLSSVRSLRADNADPKDAPTSTSSTAKRRLVNPLYAVPYLFEAREFLRVRLIGSTVHVRVDYVQPGITPSSSAVTGDHQSTTPANPASTLGERVCCTVSLDGANVAEDLIAHGLAKVVRYRADNERRSDEYDSLLLAEQRASHARLGVWSSGQNGASSTIKVQDCCGDANRAAQFLPFLRRAGRVEALVEFVASGSRMRLYVPSETCLITFLLAGVSCPRTARTGRVPAPPSASSSAAVVAENALDYTRALCLQRVVQLEVESIDKAGNFIGWMYIDSRNVSIELVKLGFSKVHFSARNSVHSADIASAEQEALEARLGVWKHYDAEQSGDIGVNGAGGDCTSVSGDGGKREVNYREVVVTDVTPDCRLFVQYAEQGPQVEELTNRLRTELAANPPLPGSYHPKRGDLCAAKFAADDQWYRARVDRVQSASSGTQSALATITYIDYGNKACTDPTRLARLPPLPVFTSTPPMAKQLAIAFIQPIENDEDLWTECRHELLRRLHTHARLYVNTEYRSGGVDHVTVRADGVSAQQSAAAPGDEEDGCAARTHDVILQLVRDGYLYVNKRCDQRRHELFGAYVAEQERACRDHKFIWAHGDFTEDDM